MKAERIRLITEAELLARAIPFYDWRDPPPRSVFMALKKGLIPDEYMEEALAIQAFLNDRPKPRPRPIASLTKGDTSPGWDNVVRALEEDRQKNKPSHGETVYAG